ncbi:protein of unknown function [Candidatus Methylocalor cossyra]|uniref:Uncharacterized protein n=1 Tax=Candidatus Methylocalor cossyra TaxID=3108543 RepID=A0ABM9NLS2_9GAMM
MMGARRRKIPENGGPIDSHLAGPILRGSGTVGLGRAFLSMTPRGFLGYGGLPYNAFVPRQRNGRGS